MEHLVTTDIDTVTLYRFSADLFPREPPEGRPRAALAGLIMDTETTGVLATDKVVEVAALPFLIDKETGELLCVFDGYNGLQDPGIPMPPEASAVNGITDELLRGKKIDWPRVVKLMHNADFIIAHNAAFDRPKIHQGLREAGQPMPNVLWACSLAQINWKKTPASPPANGLGVLCAWHGFFFAAHRALGDCQATLHLLNISKQLLPLWTTAQQPSFLVRAGGKTYQFKDIVKARGYLFYDQAGAKGWEKSCATPEEAAAEREWLREAVYKRDGDAGETIALSPKERFL